MISGYSKGNKAPETTNVKIDFSLENLDLSELRGKATSDVITYYLRNLGAQGILNRIRPGAKYLLIPGVIILQRKGVYQKMRKKSLVLIIALSMILAVAGCGKAKNEAVPEGTTDFSSSSSQISEQASSVLSAKVAEIKSHGNVTLDVTDEEMTNCGMEIGDIVTVSIGDKEYDMPVGTNYTDVDNGEMVCRFDEEINKYKLAINMGSFAEATGIGEEKAVSGESENNWTILIPEVTIQLKEKEGYLKEYRARNLERSNKREDYSELTDAEFANFRAIRASGIKENLIYRSGSPLQDDLGRNTYVMAAMEEAGIRSVINLQDSGEQMKSYSTYPGSYYSKCLVINPEMGYDFKSNDFKDKMADCLEFLIENDGPYLIHCIGGKDRTGIVCALLECFAGASYDEIAEDYMLTFKNYYKVTSQDEAHHILLNSLEKELCILFKEESLESVNLKEKAAEFFLSIGLTQEQLSSLRAKLQ